MSILEYIGLIIGVVSLLVSIASITLALVAMQKSKADAERAKEFYDNSKKFYDDANALLIKVGINSDEIKQNIKSVGDHTSMTLKNIDNQSSKISATIDSSQKTLLETISQIALINSKQNQSFQTSTQELLTRIILSPRQPSGQSMSNALLPDSNTEDRNFEE
jgi:hypothetical protein